METPQCVEVQCNVRVTTKSQEYQSTQALHKQSLPLRELKWLPQCQCGQSRAEHRLAPTWLLPSNMEFLEGPTAVAWLSLLFS